MSKVYFTSFSTPDFRTYLDSLIDSLKKFGVNEFIIYGIEDLIDTDFYKLHQNTFLEKTGFGYWLWKPYFVLKALEKLDHGDVLIYIDAASLVIGNLEPLINIAKNCKTGIVTFDASPLKNSQWTKRDTFVNMMCDESKYWTAKHVIATLFLVRKTDFSNKFILEWLRECSNLTSISDKPNLSGKPNLPDFVSHRMDQSILSILIKKYNIETYRNPSKWGNFLKMPDFRVEGEHISSPYSLDPQITEYSNEPYLNSPYGTLLEFNRRSNQQSSPGSKSLPKLMDYIKKYFKILIQLPV